MHAAPTAQVFQNPISTDQVQCSFNGISPILIFKPLNKAFKAQVIFMSRQTIKINSFFATFILMLLSFSSVSAQTWTKKYSTPINGNSGGYYEYLPEGYSSGSSKYPLIIFIHGINEKGDGSSSQLPEITGFGLPKLIKNGGFPKSFTVNGTVHKFIVIAPQFKQWPSTGDINAVYNYAVAKYRVNTAKVYLTGLSMGGALCWNFGADVNYNKKIAAMVPIAGAASASTTKAKNIADANIKAWGTHNINDTWVSPSNTKNWVAYIKNYKPTNAKISLFSGSGHDAWTKTYNPLYREDGKNVYEWMLQYSTGTTTTTNAIPVANAGSDKTITLPTSSVTLSGSGTDANGSISKYTWTKVSGPSTYTFSSTAVASPTVSALIAGTYIFRLTVTDNAGATDYDDVSVVVNSALTTTTFVVPGKVEAENYSNMYGVQKETTTDVNGGQNVGYIDLGNWMDYSIKTVASGTFTVTFRVASGASSGSQFQVKNSSGTVLATVTVPYTGGYQTWKSITASVKLVSGTQTIRLYSTNAARWNINYMSFATSTTTSTTTISTTTYPTTKIEAENYVDMSGVVKETTTDAGGGQNVGSIDQYNWMYYNINAANAGNYTFVFRLASGTSGAQFDVYDTYNSVKTLAKTVVVPSTGGWQTWKDVAVTIKLGAGAHTITLYSTATPRWNINYFKFTYAPTTTTSTTLATDVTASDVAETTSTISVSPNPFSDKFVLTVNNPYTGAMKVQLIDPSGIVRKEFQVTKNAAGTTQTYLSAGTLPAGNYFVKVQVGEWTQSTQVVKL